MTPSETISSEIDRLTKLEKDLLESVKQNPQNSDPKINDALAAIAESKIILYDALYKQTWNEASSAELASSMAADNAKMITITEDSINETKKQYNELQTDSNNKLRLIEINEYYSEMYTDWVNIMQGVAITSIVISVLSLICYLKFLPQTIYMVLVMITFVVAGVVIGIQVAYAYSHDNMNYQEWGFFTQPPSGSVNTNNPDGASGNPWSGNSGSQCPTGISAVSSILK